MIELGADPNARDSYGSSCLHRLILDSRQIISHPQYVENMDSHLKRIFNLLLKAGADIHASCETREAPYKLAEDFDLLRFIEI